MRCPLCGGDARPFARVDGQDYFRCPDCMLTFLDPARMPDLAAQKAVYDLHHNDPADTGYRAFLDRLAAPLTAHLVPGDHGLDYGCGPGPALAAMLRERGFPMAVWDPIYAPDPDALQRRYRFVTCTEVVEHLHDPAAAFERFDRLLEAGGWLGIMTMWLTDDSAFSHWHYRRDPTHVCFWQPATFTWLASRLGWTLTLPAKNVALFRKPGRPAH